MRRQYLRHREVWIKHNGPIPKDDSGRSYDIHHLDGDHTNNEPSNLIALSIKDHYQTHYDQGDYAACRAIAMRLSLSPDEISSIARESANQRLNAGTHHFLDPTYIKRHGEFMSKRNTELAEHGLNPWQNKEWIQTQIEIKRKRALDRIANGTHNFLDPEHQNMLKRVNNDRIANGTHNFQDREAARNQALKRVEDGTHHFVGGKVQQQLAKRLLDNGIHHLQTNNPNNLRASCIICRKETSIPCLHRDHKHKDNK